MNLTQTVNTSGYAPNNWENNDIGISQYLKNIFADIFTQQAYLQKKQQHMLIKELQSKTLELEQLKREVGEKDDQLRKMTYHQNHTVRRPLANILGITKMICDDLKTQPNEDLLKLMELLQSSSDELDDAIKRSI